MPALMAAAAGAALVGGLLGGNKAVTTQKIHNIISSHVGVDAAAISRVNCTQNLEVEIVHATNCPIVNRQECYAMANASLDTVISALQSAELDAELEQAIDGLSLSKNTTVTNQENRQETLNNLKAACRAEAEANPNQRMTVKIDVCNGSPIEQYQYGDAAADCVVKNIVDSAQKSNSSAQTKQENKGLNLPGSGESLIMLVGAVVLMGLMGRIGGGGGNGLEGGQNLARRALKAKRMKSLLGKL